MRKYIEMTSLLTLPLSLSLSSPLASPLSSSFVMMVGAILALNIQPAFAYIDVGSGSFFFQFLLALILGSLAYVKMAWGRLKMMFRGAPKKEAEKDKTP